MKFMLRILFLFVSCAAFAAPAERAINMRELQIYIAPDTTSQKLGRFPRGSEVAVLETSRGFLHVTDASPQGNITGWVRDKGVVRTSTPNGDRILFGEAADSENEASRRHGRRGAAQDAMRLYYRMAEYFPQSPLAGEAMWRSADVRWQLEKEDVSTRPSAKEQDAYLRGQMEERFMREVMKKFAGSKWADLAAYSLLDNKVCGEWKGLPKCPEKESEMYEKYVKEHAQSPKAAEALYEAAWRQSALIEIYREAGDQGKSAGAKGKAAQLCQNIIAQYAQQGDFVVRAQRLLYMVEQGIPTYGNAE